MIRDQLTYGLGRLSAVARQRDWGVGEDLGLTPTQGDAIRLLGSRPRGLRLGELAAQLSVRPSTASDVVKALSGKGLAVRSPDPENARSIRVSLSRDGMRILGRMPDGHTDIVNLLTQAEVEAMHGVVIRAIERLQRSGRIAPQRMCVTCRYFVPEAELNNPGPSFCNLIGQTLEPADLRVDCPEHEEADSSR